MHTFLAEHYTQFLSSLCYFLPCFLFLCSVCSLHSLLSLTTTSSHQSFTFIPFFVVVKVRWAQRVPLPKKCLHTFFGCHHIK